MVTQPTVSESRPVSGFDRLSLSNHNVPCDLTIRQGDEESLVIEAEPGVLSRVQTEVRNGELLISVIGSWSDRLADAFATSLTRKHIECTLTVKTLTSLQAAGVVRVEIPSLDTERLSLQLHGVSDIRILALTAGLLDVNMSGPGTIEVAGQALEQRVSLRGPASYTASALQSKRATVRLDGPSSAVLWVADALDIKVNGLGSIEYYGNPRVRQKVSGMASVRALGNP